MEFYRRQPRQDELFSMEQEETEETEGSQGCGPRVERAEDNRGIPEIRGKQSRVESCFRVFCVFRGSSLRHEFCPALILSGCSQISVFQPFGTSVLSGSSCSKCLVFTFHSPPFQLFISKISGH